MSEAVTKQDLKEALDLVVSVLTDAMVAMKVELQTEMSAVETRLQTEMSAVETRLTTEMSAVETRLTTEIHETSANAAQGMDEGFRDRFRAIDDKYGALPSSHATLREDFDAHVRNGRLHVNNE